MIPVQLLPGRSNIDDLKRKAAELFFSATDESEVTLFMTVDRSYKVVPNAVISPSTGCPETFTLERFSESRRSKTTKPITIFCVPESQTSMVSRTCSSYRGQYFTGIFVVVFVLCSPCRHCQNNAKHQVTGAVSKFEVKVCCNLCAMICV